MEPLLQRKREHSGPSPEETAFDIRMHLHRLWNSTLRTIHSIRRSASRALYALSLPPFTADETLRSETPSLLRVVLSHIRNRLAADDTSPLLYGLTLIVFILSFTLALFLHNTLPHSLDLIFFLGVVISAGIAGFRAGLLATALSLVSIVFFLRAQELSMESTVLSLILFTMVALLTSIVCDGLTIAHRQAEMALAQAEASNRRSLLLAQASAFLDASADCRSTLENIAHVAVPRFADWCTIDLIASEDAPDLFIAAHKDRKKIEKLHQLRSFYPLNTESDHIIARVLREGKPEFLQDVSESALIDTAYNSAHLRSLLDLNPRSVICTPLIVRGQTVGVITFVLTSEKQSYSPADLVVAKELALRVSLSMENAWLYQAAQQEIQVRKQAEERILILNEQLQRAMTETHHRVKNNLQLISAMIDIRLMDDEESYPAEEFRRLGNSVRTLAIVHDLLTHEAKKNGQTQVMSSKSVLEKLLTLMAATAGNCSLHYSIEDISLFSRDSASLALVTNELVSNAIKHGRGQVRTRFAVNDDVATLEVCDDGPGFPAHFEPLKAANTGLELVENLSRLDLHGSVRYETGPEGGGRVIVTMPLPPQDEMREMT